jgi:hypothetical protein
MANTAIYGLIARGAGAGQSWKRLAIEAVASSTEDSF